MTERLRAHDLTLRSEKVVLRPMMEEDWSLLLRWNNDPEALRFAEGDEVTHRTLQEVQRLYRGVSQAAFCFIIESGGLPVGECWLQRMNLDRVVRREEGRDCRRIDLVIGERDHWGRGIGTEAVRLLAQFGFESEGAEAIFACDVADYNERSLRLFRALGFHTYDVRHETAGQACQRHDLIRRRVPAPSGSVLEDYWGAVEAFGESCRRALAMDFVSLTGHRPRINVLRLRCLQEGAD